MFPTPLGAILDDPANKWLAIGAGMFVLAYFVLRPMGKRKQDPLGKTGSAGPGGVSRQRGVEREMSNLLVELSEMARQVTAQLDTRATKLELLMREADEKIDALQRLQASLPPDGHAQPPATTAGLVFRQSAAERDVLMQPLDAQPVQSLLPPPPAEPQVDPRHAEIYALADQGRTPHDIAAQLGRPSGEVELILALRQ